MSDTARKGFKISEEFAREMFNELAQLSGLILWRVGITWASNGRIGEESYIVEATTATEAIALAWECEDDRDLRTVHVEWLGPIECVVRKEASHAHSQATEATPLEPGTSSVGSDQDDGTE